MNPPLVPVSWGELLDKIAILRIKAQRLRHGEARANATRELALLLGVADAAQAAGAPRVSAELAAALLAVNTRLWRIEDRIREHEAAGDFGAGFVALARSVYRENDERARIKQALNRQMQSALVEEKQYAAY